MEDIILHRPVKSINIEKLIYKNDRLMCAIAMDLTDEIEATVQSYLGER